MTEEKTVSPHPETNPTRRKATTRDYAIIAALLLLASWQLGFLQASKNILAEKLSPTAKPPKNFQVIVPAGEASVDDSTQEATLGFVNEGIGKATITAVTVSSPESGKCRMATKTPQTLEPGEKIDIKATGCGKPGARFDVEINGTTALKSKATAGHSALKQLPVSGMTSEQQSLIEANLEENADKLENADRQVAFTSSGTITAE